LFWSSDSAKPKSSLLIGRLIRRGPRFQNQGAKKGGAQGRKLVYDPYENHIESIRITANKIESIRITIHKLDFFDNITKVGRIVIYEFTTPFTDQRLQSLEGEVQTLKEQKKKYSKVLQESKAVIWRKEQENENQDAKLEKSWNENQSLKGLVRKLEAEKESINCHVINPCTLRHLVR
jgi:chromosome segregation ATPase